MRTALDTDPVRAVLRDLRAYAAVEDPRAQERAQARRAELGGQLSTAEKYELYGDAPPLAIAPEEGELLYVLTRALRPALVVEFGASHGISTLYLAAALRGAGGRLVTTEIRPGKAEATAANLRRAGLDDLVDVRVGDARETLRDIEAPVDLVFLDGRNDLYLEVLRLIEPRLRPGGCVVADLSPGDPDLVPYLDYVRATYERIALAAAPGLEVSVR